MKAIAMMASKLRKKHETFQNATVQEEEEIEEFNVSNVLTCIVSTASPTSQMLESEDLRIADILSAAHHPLHAPAYSPYAVHHPFLPPRAQQYCYHCCCCNFHLAAYQPAVCHCPLLGMLNTRSCLCHPCLSPPHCYPLPPLSIAAITCIRPPVRISFMDISMVVTYYLSS